MNDRVDITIVKYYQSCFQSYEDASTTDDKFEEALKAVVSLNKNGIKVCYHSSICKIMEKFVIEFPTPEIIGCLFRSLNSYLEGVIIGKNTSRLLEKVLLACQSQDVADDEIVQFQSQKFCDYMWNHYPDYLENNIGSHIVRLFFQFVCGVYLKKEDTVYSSSNAIICKPMQENYEEKLNDLIKRFLMNPQIQQLLTNEYMSSTFQILMVLCSVRCPEKFKEVTKHLLSILCDIDGKVSKKDSNDIQIPNSFQDKYQSFFLECFILNLSKGKCLKKFSQKYCQLAQEKFIKIALENSYCCAILKAIIKRMSETDLLVEIVQQLKMSLIETNEFVCGNVFLKLLIELINKIQIFTAADQHKLRLFKQTIVEIVQFLSKNEAGVFSLTKLLTNGLKQQSTDEDAEDGDKDEEGELDVCSLYASLLMQSFFANFTPIPNSINKIFTSTDPVDIIRLASDAKASRLIDVFIMSTNVPDEIKIRFLDSLTSENCAELACNSFGSRVMDSVWASANNQLIGLVKSKLEGERQNLKSHKIGRFIESKFFGYIPKQNNKPSANNDNNKQKNNNNKNKRKCLPIPKTEQNSKKPKFK